MKFLVISDVHGNTAALDALDAEFKKADAVLFAGDFAEFMHTETALPAMEKLCSKHDDIFAVIGNCDERDFLETIEKNDISVQNTLVSYQGLSFAGAGGGTKFRGATPNERDEEELMQDLAIVSSGQEAEWDNLIVISHNPPKDTACDAAQSDSGESFHVGSQMLREFVEKYKPLALITGHIHESAAVDKIGSTTVINPGALLESKYAWLTVEKQQGKWTVTEATLHTLEA